MSENLYSNADLGFSIEKPGDWEFVPSQWALSFRRPMDPDDEEIAKVMSLAKVPFVYFQYNHGQEDLAFPIVQCNCRGLLHPERVDRKTLLALQVEQLESMFEQIEISTASSDLLISGFPTNHIESIFSVYNEINQEFKCHSRSYTVFARRLTFTIGFSGPAQGEHQREDDFKQILASVAIG